MDVFTHIYYMPTYGKRALRSWHICARVGARKWVNIFRVRDVCWRKCICICVYVHLNMLIYLCA